MKSAQPLALDAVVRHQRRATAPQTQPAKTPDRRRAANPSRPTGQANQALPAPSLVNSHVKRTTPPAPKATAFARSLDDEDAEIRERYLIERCGVAELAGHFRATPAAMKKRLERLGIRVRTQREQIEIALEKRAARRRDYLAGKERKPKPLEIPADAPRRSVRLSDLSAKHERDRIAANKAAGPAAGRDVIKQQMFNMMTYGRMRGPGMSVSEQQAAVDAFFAKGGVITSIETTAFKPPPAPQLKKGSR